MALELKSYFGKSRHEQDKKAGKYHELTEARPETEPGPETSGGGEKKQSDNQGEKRKITSKELPGDRENTVLSYGSLTTVSTSIHISYICNGKFKRIILFSYRGGHWNVKVDILFPYRRRETTCNFFGIMTFFW